MVTLDAGRLLLRRDADTEPAQLQPTSPGQFRCRGMTIRFDRGPDDKVTALAVDAGRVRDIRFTRNPS